MRNKIVFGILMFVFFVFMPRNASAWNCTVPGQIRVQVPAGTVGNGHGDGNGQVDTVEGITFECEALPTASANGSTASATGGNAAGGAATGGNATGGSGGNSSATVTGGNQSQSATASSTGGNNSNNTTTNVAAPNIPVSSAYAPTSLPSAPCIKGFGVGVQSPSAGISFGGGKVDVGCDERELARSYALLGSKIAACKILVANERSQKAGVTLEDCMGSAEPTPVAESLGDYARRVGKGKS